MNAKRKERRKITKKEQKEIEEQQLTEITQTFQIGNN